MRYDINCFFHFRLILLLVIEIEKIYRLKVTLKKLMIMQTWIIVKIKKEALLNVSKTLAIERMLIWKTGKTARLFFNQSGQSWPQYGQQAY